MIGLIEYDTVFVLLSLRCSQEADCPRYGGIDPISMRCDFTMGQVLGVSPVRPNKRLKTRSAVDIDGSSCKAWQLTEI